MNKKPKIFLSGGGTLGSVMPLYALCNQLKKEFELFWIGSFRGPERNFLSKKNIKYIAIPSGKLRKYFSIKNLFSPLFVFLGLINSFILLLRYSPKIVVVSGSFISVPVVWAAWILGIPIIVHQEDIKVGLAGKLSIKFASVVTVAFRETLDKIQNKNKFWIGNPVREDFFEVDKTDIARWKKNNLPLILVLGGGLGAKDINNEIERSINELTKKANIVHITGKNKELDIRHKNYQQFFLLDKDFYSVVNASDIVISRAGLSTIAELSALSKPSILIPLKGVGQYENAKYLEKRGATILLEQDNLKALKNVVLELLNDKKKQVFLRENIRGVFPFNSREKMLQLIKRTI